MGPAEEMRKFTYGSGVFMQTAFCTGKSENSTFTASRVHTIGRIPVRFSMRYRNPASGAANITKYPPQTKCIFWKRGGIKCCCAETVFNLFFSQSILRNFKQVQKQFPTDRKTQWMRTPLGFSVSWRKIFCFFLLQQWGRLPWHTHDAKADEACAGLGMGIARQAA